MFKKVIALIVLFIVLPIFANDQKIVVSQDHPTFTITLASNPTTGYSWKLKSYDANLVKFMSHQFIAPKNKKLVGAPGYEQWVFKANKARYRVNQVGHIRFEYERPWEKQAVKEVNFMVVVEK